MEQAKDTFNSAVERTRELGSNIGNTVSEMGSNIGNTVSDLATNTRENLQNTYEDISSRAASASQSIMTEQPAENASGISAFFSANTLVSKIAFIFFIIIVFLILMKVGIMLIGLFTGKPKDPFIIKGNLAGTTSLNISRDPSLPTSVTLPRSNNEKDGAEFTWAFWLNVNSLTNERLNEGGKTYHNHVFNVGNAVPSIDNGIMTINNAPGVYLTEYKNIDYNPDGKGHGLKMHIVMDTEPTQTEQGADTTNKTLDITELPFNNWFHVAIRLKNTVMDVYVNGTIAGRIHFQTVPKQNYYDVNVCNNSGFNGNLSNLRYYSRALNVFDINSIVLAGPDLSSAVVSGNNTGSTALLNNYGYISNTWYMKKL